MFTIQDIKKLQYEYFVFTNIAMPHVQSVKYVDNDNFFGRVNNKEMAKGHYEIILSNSLNDCHELFQKAIVFHELTHVYDCFYYFQRNLNIIDSILSTYSEAHASEIGIRFLLNLKSGICLNDKKQTFPWKDKEATLYDVVTEYGNICISNFRKCNGIFTPDEFGTATKNFMYLCGALSLYQKTTAFKMVSYIISLCPTEFNNVLLSMYKSIVNKNVVGCAEKYKELFDLMAHL